MKIYDSIYDLTIDLLILLNHFYSQFDITKPHTSRPASSERYLICGGFRGISKDYLNKIKQVLIEWGEIESSSDYLKNEKFINRLFKS